MRSKIIGLLIGLIVVGGILLCPLKRDVNLKKPIKHFINGVMHEQSEIVIEGEITYSLLSSKMTFVGDIKIEKLHNQLRDVKIEIILDKKNIVEVPVIRTGIEDTSKGAVAKNDSIGIMHIKRDFESLILYPVDKNTNSINIDKNNYWRYDETQ